MLNKKTISMKELPENERPYEKCLSYGPAFLSNAELIAVILKSGTKDESSVELAMTLLAKFAGAHTLADLFQASVTELTETKGIGKVKAVSLMCVGELCKRISKETAIQKICLASPASVASFYMESMRHLKQEEIRLALFDTKNNLIKDLHLSTGTINATLATPREVYLKALKYGAVYLVILHNHPSGDPEPSAEDIELTRRLKDCGELVGIPLVDHIIIGDNCFVSFRDKGLI